MRLFSFCTYVCKIWNNDLTEYQVWYKLTELLKAFRHFLTANRKKRRSKQNLFIVLAVKETFERFSCLVVHSLQCRRFPWGLNLLAKATCWNFSKRGGDRASQRERGGGGEREEKTAYFFSPLPLPPFLLSPSHFPLRATISTLPNLPLS